MSGSLNFTGPRAQEVIRLALLGHDATAVCDELKYARCSVLKIIRLAKQRGIIPETIWGTFTKISDECREGVLNDWASCQFREYEIFLRNKLPPGYKIASITERARLRGDPRALGYRERKVRLEAYLKSLAAPVETSRGPTLAEQMGIRIGRVVIRHNTDHQTSVPRRNIITLSGGLIANHA